MSLTISAPIRRAVLRLTSPPWARRRACTWSRDRQHERHLAFTDTISGTPGGGAAAGGPYSVTEVANDGTTSASPSFNWNVKDAIVFATTADQTTNAGSSGRGNDQPPPMRTVATPTMLLSISPTGFEH